MTLFEKVYFTCLIINIVLLFVACCLESDDGIKVIQPFVIQFILTILYIVVKLILLIWGVEIHWFPSLRIGVAE